MANKILVSFKKREQDLYEQIMSQGDHSNFIKDALKYYLNQDNQSRLTNGVEENDENGIMDIMGL